MSDQPEALRLAEELGAPFQCDFHVVCEEAAAELRRLHEENEKLNADIESWRMTLAAATTLGEKVTAENERLREALVRFGRHHQKCDAYRGCVCGLDAALRREGK